MPKTAVTRALRLAALPLIALLAYYVLLFTFQSRLIYPAPTGPFAGVVPSDAVALTLGNPQAPVHVWHLPSDSSTPTGVVIFFHGNGERAEEWLNQFRALRRTGLAIVVVEYPGYGVARGAPSQASFTDAALAAYDWTRTTPQLKDAPVIVYGRSLGGGVATRLATRRSVAALILESSFTDLRSLASGFFAPGFLVRDPFDNLQELKAYAGPLLVLHGERDELAPVEGGRALAAAVARAEFIRLDCGHNDCVRPWQAILQFLRQRGLAGSAA